MRSMLLLTLATAALAAPASAGTFTPLGSATTSAVDNCNGALPGFEGALRKRALAVANEGTSTAFVSCAVTVDEVNSAGNILVAAYATNRAATPQILSCTFVDGGSDEIAAFLSGVPTAVYRTKVVAITPGTANSLRWTPAEFGVARFSRYASVSCSLTPGMELNIVGGAWEEPTN